MTKKDTHESDRPAHDPQHPPSPTAEDQAGTTLNVGDRVQIDATVAAITGDALTLKVDRLPATGSAADGAFAPTTTDGAELTLNAKQVHKAKTTKSH